MEPWAVESRDLLKARLVGRKVGVTVEYEKIQASPAQPGNMQKRVFGTMKVLTGKEGEGQGKNVALMLVSEGVATCTKHRDGEERSCEYDSYLMAEAETAAKGKGLHGDQPAPSSLTSATKEKVQDLTIGSDSKKAKSFISLILQRGSTGSSSNGVTLRGTVEFVYSGSRFKVLLPSEGCVLQLTLSQVKTKPISQSTILDSNDVLSVPLAFRF
jgi:staphylococcal nuclease domain-containing protein 1